jgi:hypothetical protein
VALLRDVAFRNPILRTISGMAFIDDFVQISCFTCVPLFTMVRFNWEAKNLGAFFFTFGVMTPLQLKVVMPQLLKKGEGFVLKLGYSCRLLAYIGFFAAGQVGSSTCFLAVICLYTLGSIALPVQISMANRQVNEYELGRLSGAFAVLDTLGRIVAPMLATMVLTSTVHGALPSFTFLACGCMLAPGVMLAFKVARMVAHPTEGVNTEHGSTVELVEEEKSMDKKGRDNSKQLPQEASLGA